MVIGNGDRTMASKIEKNKKEKEKSLYKAAYELFISKGINRTTIKDIVDRAGVGKGTFYLYFNDKYDILDRIVLKKSSEVLCKAIGSTNENSYKNFEEELLYFIDYIIEYFKKDRLSLKLIHKNLSWALLKKGVKDFEGINNIYLMFEKGYKNKDVSPEYIDNILFIIVELVGGIIYNSIILEEPADIDRVKPILFETVLKII